MVSRNKMYLLKNKVGVSPANTLDGCNSEHNIAFAINVGVHNTQDVLKVGRKNQRHGCSNLNKMIKINMTLESLM